MSEQKRAQLAETLSLLNAEDRVWAINFLVKLLSNQASDTKKKAKRVCTNHYTEQEWEDYFNSMPAVDLPRQTESMTQILHKTTGKTIKPLEKWL